MDLYIGIDVNKFKEGHKMTNYKEILRLSNLGIEYVGAVLHPEPLSFYTCIARI